MVWAVFHVPTFHVSAARDGIHRVRANTKVRSNFLMLCASGGKGATTPLTPVLGVSLPPSPGKCDPFFFRTVFGRKTDRSCRVR